MNVPFRLFGPLHLAILAAMALSAWWLVIWARRATVLQRQHAARILATVIVVNELWYWVYQIGRGAWTFPRDLPLQICDLAVLLVGWALWQPHRRRLTEIAYCWGAAGTLQALLTPDLPAQIPLWYFLKFFLTHCGVVVGVICLAGALGWRPQRGAVWRMLLVTDIYAAVIGIFNVIYGTNYLYLCAKPVRPSLLDWLGPWPWYILSLQVVGVALFGLCLLPLRRRAI